MNNLKIISAFMQKMPGSTRSPTNILDSFMEIERKQLEAKEDPSGDEKSSKIKIKIEVSPMCGKMGHKLHMAVPESHAFEGGESAAQDKIELKILAMDFGLFSLIAKKLKENIQVPRPFLMRLL